MTLLRASGYGVTVINAEGATGPVKLIFTILERCDIARVVGMIREHNPLAFYSVEDIRTVSEAVTPFRLPSGRRWSRLRSRRIPSSPIP